MSTASEAQPGAPAKPPATLWERILTTTPVVLTVIATLLAGQSSSELTRAQYHRSLAAQTQSKVGGQWAFFQAKRTRKVILEKTGDLLETLTVAGRLDAPMLQRLADRLPDDFRLAERQAQQVLDGLARVAGARAAGGSLRTAAERVREEASHGVRDAETARQKMAGLLAALTRDGQLEVILGYLNSEELPAVSQQHPSNAEIVRACEAIAGRRPEAETLAAVRQVKPEALRQAIEASEAAAAAFDQQTRPIDALIRRLSDAVAAEVRLARRLARSTRDLRLALAATEESMPPNVRTTAERLEQHAADVRTSADELGTALRAAWNRFTARRYDRDAQYNWDTALLYEVEVHQQSAQSDRHLQRSRNFFYGMLAAQMAVTIATLALAVRQRSVLWGLASLAGLGAVLYGVYVYLDLAP